MISVLHVADKLSVGESTIHGVTRLFSWWVPGFEKNQFDVMVCSLRSQDKAGDFLEGLGVKVFYLNRGKFDPRTLSSLVKFLKDEKVDIVHLHGYGSWTFGRIAAVICHIPAIVHEHMVDDSIPWYQRIVDKLLAPLTERGIAVSKAVSDFMIDRRSINPGKMEIVYNGIPGEYCSKYSDASKDEFASEIGVKRNGIIMGVVGRLHPLKGQDIFLDAASIISAKHPNVYFTLVGDGEFREALESKAEKLQIKDRVRFVGHVDDVRPLVSLMDVLVITSHSEGFSLVAVEGMAAGKAIAGTNVGGLPEVVKDGETGLLVPPGDPRVLAAALERILNDKALRLFLAENAEQDCKERFMISSTVREFRRIYRDALRKASLA